MENPSHLHPQSGNVVFKQRPRSEDVPGSQPRKAIAPDWWNKPIDGIEEQPTYQPPVKENSLSKQNQKPKNPSPSPSPGEASPEPPVSNTDTSLQACSPVQSEPATPEAMEPEQPTLHDLVPPEYRSCVARAATEVDKMTLLKEVFESWGVHFYEFSGPFKERVQERYQALNQKHLWSTQAYRALKSHKHNWSPGKIITTIQRALSQVAFIEALTESEEQ